MPNVYSSLTFTKDFKIASIHALKSVELSNNSMLSKLTRFGYQYTYRWLDKVVCISKAIKEDLIENCNFNYVNKLRVIYNPHDLEEIRNRSKAPIHDKQESALFDHHTILFIGRLSTQKSPWHLIKAFSLLKKEMPAARLVFIGDGDIRVQKYLEELIEKFDLKESTFFLG